MKKKITILDYNMGNLFSVKNAFLSFGVETKISSNSTEFGESDALIIPGVGAFGEAVDNLKKRNLINPIIDFYNTGKPIMGICLGLQLFFENSEEFGYNKGLGIIKGDVLKFKTNIDSKQKIPHMGWNKVLNEKNETFWEKSPLNDIPNDAFMYFVHSYYVKPVDEDVVLSTTEYLGNKFCSSIKFKNIFACQFHPEKSGKDGINIFKKWHDLIP